MSNPPEITTEDFVRFLQSSRFSNRDGQSREELDAWLEQNGLTQDLIELIGEAMVDNFLYRLLHAEGVPIVNLIVFNVSLTAFELGWEASREFAQRTEVRL